MIILDIDNNNLDVNGIDIKVNNHKIEELMWSILKADARCIVIYAGRTYLSMDDFIDYWRVRL